MDRGRGRRAGRGAGFSGAFVARRGRSHDARLRRRQPLRPHGADGTRSLTGHAKSRSSSVRIGCARSSCWPARLKKPKASRRTGFSRLRPRARCVELADVTECAVVPGCQPRCRTIINELRECIAHPVPAGDAVDVCPVADGSALALETSARLLGELRIDDIAVHPNPAPLDQDFRVGMIDVLRSWIDQSRQESANRCRRNAGGKEFRQLARAQRIASTWCCNSPRPKRAPWDAFWS